MNQSTEGGLTTADLAHAGTPATPENTRLPQEEKRPLADDRASRMTLRREEEMGAERDRSTTFDPTLAQGAGAVDTRSAAPEAESTPLLAPQEAAEFHARWNSVQVGFVDEPRHAVEEADGLVAAAIKRLAEVFAKERAQLDSQWDQGENVSTEDLRLALQRYRSFFGRLLSV